MLVQGNVGSQEIGCGRLGKWAWFEHNPVSEIITLQDNSPVGNSPFSHTLILLLLRVSDLLSISSM
jgi:hypothetical protein